VTHACQPCPACPCLPCCLWLPCCHPDPTTPCANRGEPGQTARCLLYWLLVLVLRRALGWCYGGVVDCVSAYDRGVVAGRERLRCELLSVMGPWHLRLLADWVDVVDRERGSSGDEVQVALRRFAEVLEG
jgi:hypothetical protein